MADAAVENESYDRRGGGDGAAILSLVLALVAFAFLLLASVARTCVTVGGEETCVTQWNDIRASLVLSAAPLMASGLPVVFLRSSRSATLRTAAAVILSIFVLIGFMLAPGLLFLPSTAAMWVSVTQAREGRPNPGSAARVVAAVSLALAITAAVALLFMSSGERCISRAGSGQPETTVCSSTTLLESQGSGVIGILIVPVALAGVPVLAGRHRNARALRAIRTAVLLGFVLLGLFSIGLFFVPSMLAMVVAASFEDSESLGLEPVAH